MIRTYLVALGLVGCLPINAISQTKDGFHHPAISSKLNFDSLYSAAIDLSKSARGQKVVEQCIERYGGRDKLGQLQAARLTYRMLLMMSKDSTTVVKSYADNRRYKITRQQADAEELRILNRDSAWFVGRDTMFAMQKTRYCAELFSYLVLTLPRTLYAESFSAMKYGARAKDSVEYIYCRKNDSLMMVVGISPKDFSIVSAEGIILGDSPQVTFVNKFADFGMYDGFLFPREMINISMGLEVGRSKLKSVEVNPVFDVNEFRAFQPATSKPQN